MKIVKHSDFCLDYSFKREKQMNFYFLVGLLIYGRKMATSECLAELFHEDEYLGATYFWLHYFFKGEFGRMCISGWTISLREKTAQYKKCCWTISLTGSLKSFLETCSITNTQEDFNDSLSAKSLQTLYSLTPALRGITLGIQCTPTLPHSCFLFLCNDAFTNIPFQTPCRVQRGKSQI